MYWMKERESMKNKQRIENKGRVRHRRKDPLFQKIQIRPRSALRIILALY